MRGPLSEIYCYIVGIIGAISAFFRGLVKFRLSKHPNYIPYSS